MNEHDHFSSVLDVDSVEAPLEPHFDGHVEIEADDDEAGLHEQQAPRKKPIPKALLLIGGMVAFVVVGAGYQHFFGAHPQNVASVGMMGNSGADAGDTPLPSGTAITQQAQSGMLTQSMAAPPLPNRMGGQASEPIGAVASQQDGRNMPGHLPMGASIASVGGSGDDTSRDSAATAASAVVPQTAPIAAPAAVKPAAPIVSAMIPASSPPGSVSGPLVGSTPAAAGGDAPAAMQVAMAPDAKDVQIAKLQAQIEALQRRDHAVDVAAATARPAAHGTGRHAGHGARIVRVHASGAAAGNRSARHAHRQDRTNTEVLVGYAIKQVIPGQGWIQDEESGKQQVVAVGDSIGTAKVVRIDADNYRIVTTAGVIQ